MFARQDLFILCWFCSQTYVCKTRLWYTTTKNSRSDGLQQTATDSQSLEHINISVVDLFLANMQKGEEHSYQNFAFSFDSVDGDYYYHNHGDYHQAYPNNMRILEDHDEIQWVGFFGSVILSRCIFIALCSLIYIYIYIM